LGKDIASLQDILRAPKLRGNLGEQFLEQSLALVLPHEAFEMQHRFNNGSGSVVVDAVVRLGDRLVPIDSKFPLESFQRLLEADTDEARARARKAFVVAVRSRIDEIAEKYVRPEAGTYDFALMYLPAENVYYEAVIRDDGADASSGVVAYASRKKVILVSPNTLLAYLLTIAHGLKGLQIEKKAERFQRDLAGVQTRFSAFVGSFELVGRHLGNAWSKYEEAEKKAGTLQGQIAGITGSVLDLDSTRGLEGEARAAGTSQEE
jgi:DNA recombination protein RmuC